MMKEKNKKIVLLISTILTLLITLGFTISLITGNLELSSVGDIIQLSFDFQLGILLICILANLFSIYFILNGISIHKKKIIILNVIQLLFGTTINIVFGIINICITASKTKDVEETIKITEKPSLPILEDITKFKWYIYLLIFIFLFVIYYTPALNYLPIPQTKTATLITLVILYIVQIVGLVLPMFNELKRDFIVFKNNFTLYLKNILPRFGLIIITYFISNASILFLLGNIPNNQQTLISMPLYFTGILAIIIGPLTEELMFRGFFKKFIKNDILFVILSSITFGALHVLSANSLQQFLYIIPYSILGLAFSLNYVKTKNIVSNIFLHSSWNTLAFIILILVYK